MARWGRAGERLTDQESAARDRQTAARRNRARQAREADDQVAYRLWQAGELRPYLVTLALDARGLSGPEVDEACGAREPDVDLWEEGKLYPTWPQLKALAELTGVTPRLLCSRRELLRVEDTSLRFHGHRDPIEPPVLSFPPDIVAATVNQAGGDVNSGRLPDEPNITARRPVYWAPVSVIGTDEHGHTLIVCPHCHDDAYIGEDGRVVCPTGEAINRVLEAGLRYLEPAQEAPAALRRPD